MWRGTYAARDSFGEATGTTDGRGVSEDPNGIATLQDPGGLYTSRTTYNAWGDQASASTPPITTTVSGITTTAPATTTNRDDADGNQTSMTLPNGNTTAYTYDHLGRQVQTMLPPVAVVPAGNGGIGPHLRLGNSRPATAVPWQTTSRLRSNGPATAVPWQTTVLDRRVPRLGTEGPVTMGRLRSDVARGRLAAAHARALLGAQAAPLTTTPVIALPILPTVSSTTPLPTVSTTPLPTQAIISSPAATTASAAVPASPSATASASAPTSVASSTTPTSMPTPVPTTLPSDTPTGTSTPGTGTSATPLTAASPAASVAASSLLTATTALTDATAGLGAGQLASYGRLPLSFEANRGQTDASVGYLAHGAGYGLYLTGADAVLALSVPPTPTVPGTTGAMGLARGALDTGLLTPTVPLSETAVRLHYVGAASPVVEGQQRLPGDANYFLGSDPSGWRTNIPTYARIVYHDVYPGIDLAYHGTQGRLEYDWTVAPGVSPAAIAFTVDGAGARGLSLDAAGNLALRTPAGAVQLDAPVAYQLVNGARRAVQASFALTGTAATATVGVAVGAYDPRLPLVIDPVLGYSTYLGGSGAGTVASGIAVDGAGDAYVVGSTSSLSFPTKNAFSGKVGDIDVFVSKLAPDGQSLLYSTYLGSTGDDQGLAIAVGAQGNAYLTGWAGQADYPTTAGSARTSAVCARSVFVTELSAAGNTLAYSACLGTVSPSSGQAIAVDSAGHAYIGGWIAGYNGLSVFPGLTGAYQPSFGGGNLDGFVGELSADGSTVLYGTYLGGSGDDQINGLALDGNAVAVAGWTTSTTFPTAGIPAQGTNGGGAHDAVLSELVPDLTKTPAQQLAYSTYLGGTGDDQANAVAVDGSGSVYVAGATTGGFPTTAGAYQRTYGGGAHNAFLARLSSGGGLASSTYLGGSGDDQASAVAVDGSGNAFLTGSTTSTTFPITGTAFQAANRGQSDAFVAELGAGLTGTASLLASSYLGGSGADQANGLALDSVGNAYLTGKTTSTDFTTLTPYSATNVANGAYDSFVTRVGTALPRGTIGTVAGVGGAYGYSGDGGRATAAQLSYPVGEPAVDGAGDIFFADTSTGGCARSSRPAEPSRPWSTARARGASAATAGRPRRRWSTRPRAWPWMRRATCTSPTPTTTACARCWPPAAWSVPPAPS